MEDIMSSPIEKLSAAEVAQDLSAEDGVEESQGRFFDRLRNKKTAILASSLAIAASGFLGKINQSEAANRGNSEPMLIDTANDELSASNSLTPEVLAPADKKLYNECVSSAIHGAISGVGYRVINRNHVEWSFDAQDISTQCLKYGKRVVKFYAASFKPGEFPTHPHRLGNSVTYTNPTAAHTYYKRQTLTNSIPSIGAISDVETMSWVPKTGLGKTKSYTVVGRGAVIGYPQ